jgi:hypothetical protein
VVGRKSRGGHPPSKYHPSARSTPRGQVELRDLKDRTDLKDVCTDDRLFEPVGSPRRTPNTSPTEPLTRRGVPHLQMGRGSGCIATGTAADSGKVMPLLTIQGRLGAPDAHSSLVERGTWHIDGSQCGIGIRVSDHVMVIVTARIWWSATSTREQ